MSKPRIKVNPTTGQIVVWEPERTPKAPWFSIYAPDRNPGDASQFLFTDEDVKNWPEWLPENPLTPGASFKESAENIVAGQQVLYRSGWFTIREALTDEDGVSLYFVGRKAPLMPDLGDQMTVRNPTREQL